MTPGSRERRIASGFAVLTIAVLAGCHGASIGRITPNRPQSAVASAGRAAFLPATVAMDQPAEMASIEPVADPMATEPSSGLAVPPRLGDTPPTPLIDAAMEKARAHTGIVVDEMTRPPAPAPPSREGPPKPEPAAVAVAAPPVPAVPARDPRPAEPPRPDDLWRDGVRQLAGLARARLDQAGGATSPWALRARLLAWLAEPDIDPDFGQHEADGTRAVLRALDDSQSGTPARGDEVRAAVQAIEDKAPLEIVDLRLCSKVDRFGDFEPYEPPVRKAGQIVVVYCEVDGLRYETTSAGFRTRLAAQVEVIPDGGGPPVLVRSLPIAEETCRRRRRDYYIAYRLVLPRPIAPGDYKLRITERDLIADRSAAREVGLAIAAD